jgi:peptide/nickel transport system permease protein
VLQGDLGESFFYKKTVLDLILERLEPTLMLSLCTIVLAVVIAVPLGVLAAYRHDTWIDRATMAFSVVGFSVPVFVIGYLMIQVFALDLGWLPVQGYGRLANGFGGFIERMILPSATLSVIYIALIARITRASILDVRAKGLSDATVLRRHALRNAAVPIVTVVGIGIALLIGGAIVTESVYNIPGLGRLVVDAVLARDFPIIQAVILVFSVAYVVVNLAIDLAYTFFDPRIRY